MTTIPKESYIRMRIRPVTPHARVQVETIFQSESKHGRTSATLATLITQKGPPITQKRPFPGRIAALVSHSALHRLATFPGDKTPIDEMVSTIYFGLHSPTAEPNSVEKNGRCPPKRLRVGQQRGAIPDAGLFRMSCR